MIVDAESKRENVSSTFRWPDSIIYTFDKNTPLQWSSCNWIYVDIQVIKTLNNILNDQNT